MMIFQLTFIVFWYKEWKWTWVIHKRQTSGEEKKKENYQRRKQENEEIKGKKTSLNSNARFYQQKC